MNSALARKVIAKVTSESIVGALLLSAVIELCATEARADVIFSDNFKGSTLNPAWQVLPGYGSYTVGGGNLRYFDDGPVASTTGWYNAALTLALPFSGTNWEVDTKATYHLDWLLPGYGSYTGPSVPTPYGSAGAQGPEVLVKFAPGTVTSAYGGPNYAGTDYAVFERNIDAYYGANTLSAGYGSVSNGGLLNPADSNINNNIADGTYWLQIIRDGGMLEMNYSYDGSHFLNALTTTLADPSSSNNELLLGGITYLTAGSYTDYSYVKITSPVPEPNSLVLLSLVLGGLSLGWLRKRSRRPRCDDQFISGLNH